MAEGTSSVRFLGRSLLEEHRDDDREQADTLNKGGKDDGVGTDDIRCFRLTGDGVVGVATNFADAEACADGGKACADSTEGCGAGASKFDGGGLRLKSKIDGELHFFGGLDNR